LSREAFDTSGTPSSPGIRANSAFHRRPSNVPAPRNEVNGLILEIKHLALTKRSQMNPPAGRAEVIVREAQFGPVHTSHTRFGATGVAIPPPRSAHRWTRPLPLLDHSRRTREVNPRSPYLDSWSMPRPHRSPPNAGAPEPCACGDSHAEPPQAVPCARPPRSRRCYRVWGASSRCSSQGTWPLCTEWSRRAPTPGFRLSSTCTRA